MLIDEVVTRDPISKGWSCDRKFCVTARDGTKYLLRITPSDKSASRGEMFRMQQRAASLGIPMCRPVEIGPCADGLTNLDRRR